MRILIRPLEFLPRDTKIPFVSFYKICMTASAVLMVLSLVLFVTRGLNYGIDFLGGTLIEVRNPSGAADIAALRSRLTGLGLGEIQIQEFGAPEDALIRVAEQPGGEKAQQQVVEAVRGALGDSVEYRRIEVVGPAVSHDLIRSGIIAVTLAMMAILIYIWFRFEWQFAVGAVIALVHDVTLTIGIFSVLQLEFGLPIIAALLTIIGYSINDTVVVYDRIRENLRKFKKMPLDELIDLSINETLSRTLLTSVTTLLALVALYIFGGEVIRAFNFAMICGVVVGTYSSVFIASPLLLIFGVKRDWSGLGGAKIKEPPAGRRA